MSCLVSHWESESFFSHWDVVIVGAGIVGLSTALHLLLRAPALRVVVLERGVLPTGASTKNAGFACFGSVAELAHDLQTQTAGEVFALVERRYRGLQRLRELLGDAAIGYEPFGSHELFFSHESAWWEQCRDLLPTLNEELARITRRSENFSIADAAIPAMGFARVDHLIANAAEAQIDTGRMMRALLARVTALGAVVLTGVAVEKICDQPDSIACALPDGRAFVGRVGIVTTNGFARELLPALDVQPARAQVVITQPIPNLHLRGTFHGEQGYLYFRNVGDRILLGGGRNLDLTGEATTDFAVTETIQTYLQNLLRTVILPDTPVAIERTWCGIMGIGTHKVPIIRQCSPHLYCAVRMGGMGVAIGTLVGEEAVAIIPATIL